MFENPFDDPEVRAAMAAAGIVHKPGLAAQHLAELGPLLAAEGIDLDNLGDIDIPTLNEALRRATEQYNLELFTPVGLQRRQTMEVLWMFADAIDVGDFESAEEVLAEVQPEPTDELPAISHVIGVGLGLLDTWFADRALRDILWNRRMPAWRTESVAAANGILSRAREGRAFDSLDKLVLRYHGLAVFEGTALAVVSCLDAVMNYYGTDLDSVAARLLSDKRVGPPYHFEPKPARRGKAKPRKAKRGNPDKLGKAAADWEALHDFEAWLGEQETIAAPSVDDESEVMEALIRVARHLNFDPHTAAGCADFADRLTEDGTIVPGMIMASLGVLTDYARFREVDGFDPDWRDTLVFLAETIQDVFPEKTALSNAIMAASEIDPDQRRAAYAETLVVRRVADLLAWIGKGRPVTGTGALRRADIADVAALLGVNAVGVNKVDILPLDQLVDESGKLVGPYQATSMYEVPLLGAWWQSLIGAKVIETTKTRVRPGPAAADWLAGDLPPGALAEMLIPAFVGEVLAEDAGRSLLGGRVVELLSDVLLRAVAPDDERLDFLASLHEDLFGTRVRRYLDWFDQVGLLTVREEGSVYIIPELRGVMAWGLMYTSSALQQMRESDEWE